MYNLWNRWSERVDADMKSGIDVFLDLKKPLELSEDEDTPPSTQPKEKRNRKSIEQGGVEGIDVGYNKLTPHLEKNLSLLAHGEGISCAICNASIERKTLLVLTCPEQECRMSSHLNCLAQRFLQEEGEKSSVLPISGKCPQCRSRLRWIDLVKELSLRLCGEARVARLLKKPKTRTKKASCGNTNFVPAVDETLADATNYLTHDQSGSDDDSSTGGATSDEQLVDDWYYQRDDDDTMSVTSNASGLSSCFDAPSPTKQGGSAPSLGMLIEDSEWDDAEILD